jgi:hypothetical protein
MTNEEKKPKSINLSTINFEKKYSCSQENLGKRKIWISNYLCWITNFKIIFPIWVETLEKKMIIRVE